jgi:hypothetical protein
VTGCTKPHLHREVGVDMLSDFRAASSLSEPRDEGSVVSTWVVLGSLGDILVDCSSGMVVALLEDAGVLLY